MIWNRTYRLHRVLEAGVKVGAGTDAGGHQHRINARELQCMVEAGMSPMQALQAATGWAAECLGIESDVGTIQPGKLADLVVVDGDPLQDIGVLQDHQRINWSSRRASSVSTVASVRRCCRFPSLV